jgi:hypothetical protein
MKQIRYRENAKKNGLFEEGTKVQRCWVAKVQRLALRIKGTRMKRIRYRESAEKNGLFEEGIKVQKLGLRIKQS